MSDPFLDYDLPPGLIAQTPTPRREDSRLLVVERATGALHDARFSDIGAWLRAGDVLALNETRVRPARIDLLRPTGGRIEVLFVRPEPAGVWRVLARPAKRARAGDLLRTADGSFEAEVVGHGEEHGERLLRVRSGDLDATLKAQGEIPLPPYIHRTPDASDLDRYQTVYSREEGAVAAPTAGLHFSEGLLADLEGAGVARALVLLHVGPGTFRPLAADDPKDHRMDEEWFEVPAPAAETLNRMRAAGGRIVAVGTTAVRALESACDAHGGTLAAASGFTRKYILPPYEWQAVDALVTNFHLPRTTLLLLVAAFAGEDVLRRAYQHAIAAEYRFYSYGDAMLIV